MRDWDSGNVLNTVRTLFLSLINAGILNPHIPLV